MKKHDIFVMLMGIVGMVAVAGGAAADHHEASRQTQVWLGVAVSELPFARLEELAVDHGVAVDQVQPESPADKAGIHEGDVIVALDDKAAFSVRRLQWLVKTYDAGDNVELDIRRDGEAQRVQVTLDIRSGRERFFSGRHPHHGEIKKSYLGVTLQALSDDLREHFGAPADRGVLIAKVFEDSPAAAAGLNVGDVIIKMDRRQIHFISDVHRVLNYFDAGEEIVVEVIRDKQRRALNVSLAARPAHHDRRDHPRQWPPFHDPKYWHEEFKRYRDDWREYWNRHYPQHDYHGQMG